MLSKRYLELHMSIETSRLLLSTMRGLWGIVTPNLRKVSIELVNNVINVNFYYDKEPSENERELAEETATEVIADFTEPYLIACNIETIPFPKKIEQRGHLVYSRYE